jgi:shikimate kinase
MNVYLIGFMASGKTSVGKELAKKLKWQFVDLDELIELREKRLIKDIFAQDGEAYFRRVEKRVLKEAAKEKKFVIACGGGVVLDKDNIALMKESGTIICLKALPEVILKRSSGTAQRPLLNVPNPQEKIALLLKLRAPYYAQAEKVVDTSRLSVKEVVTKLYAFLRNR